jgi:hypothetical protein
MKINLSVFIFLMSVIQLCAQNQLLVEATELHDGMQEIYGYQKESEIEGSPYLSEDKFIGTFYQKNKTVVKTPTRLNCYFGNFEYVANGKTYLVNASTIDSIKIEKETYVFRTFFNENGGKSIKAVKVIVSQDGKAFYEYKGVELKPEVKPAGYVDPKPARFEWSDPIYLFEIKGKVIVLKTLKDIASIFPRNENEIKKLIKENRISISKPDKLRKLLNYISQLKEE